MANVGVRSSYKILGERNKLKHGIKLFVRNMGSGLWGLFPNYTFDNEIAEGQYLDIAPMVRDFINQKYHVNTFVQFKVEYLETDWINQFVYKRSFTHNAGEGYLYSNQDQSKDIFEGKSILMSANKFKISGDEYYITIDPNPRILTSRDPITSVAPIIDLGERGMLDPFVPVDPTIPIRPFGNIIKIKSYPQGLIDINEYVLTAFGFNTSRYFIRGYRGEDYLVIEYMGEKKIIDIDNEYKYKTHQVDFVNKFGVWERIYFTKKETNSMSLESSEYNSMTKGDYIKFAVDGREKAVLNTFWIPEAMNETIKQLLLSEDIYLDGERYNIDQKSITFKSRVNDDLIQYEIQFINANNVIG